MKKIISLFICLFSFVYPVCAQDVNPYTYNNNTRQPKDQGLNTDNSTADMENSDDFYNEMIKQQYGSNQSPAFLNREDINPNEDSYDYGYSGGDD